MIAALVLALGLTVQVHAQDNTKKKPPSSKGVESKDTGKYFNVAVGRLLPFGIYGVRDVYPYWSARFGHPWGGTNLEWTYANVHARGVMFHMMSASLAFPSELESWKFIPYIGVDTSYYSGHTNRRQLPYSTSMGGHLGVSPILEFNDNVWIRFDFKFNFNPGRSLNVGTGIQINF